MKIAERYEEEYTNSCAHFDVIICGGGPSGMIAAAASALLGARTALVEKNAFLGGLATGGLVNPISEFHKNGIPVIGGLPWKFIELLDRLGGAELGYPIGNIPFDPEVYKLAAQRFVLDAGVRLFLGCTLTGCVSRYKTLESLSFINMGREYTLEADYFVDCTGDAVLSHMAGVPLQEILPEQLQPASLCFRLAGVDTNRLEHIRFREEHTKYANVRVRRILEELKAKGHHIPGFGGPWFHYGMHSGVVTVNITRAQVKPDDLSYLSEMECQLREDVFCFVRILREYVPEFKDCYLLDTGIAAGHRESRRIQGVHLLTGEEFLIPCNFPDAIARSAHPVDIHRAGDSGQEVRFLSEAGYIPYRCLYADGFPNLLVAGRCISADRIASASVRIQAACMATGQAAGTAAALCSAAGYPVQALKPELLRKTLRVQGALI